MTQRQAAMTSVGEYLQRREAFERLQQIEWERSRWMAWSIFTPFVGKKAPKSPVLWVRFPWEEKKSTPMVHIDDSQLSALNNIFNDFQNRKKA